MEMMHIKSKAWRPVKQPNGTWKLVAEYFYEDIPNLGRTPLSCNKCDTDNYPECKKKCGITDK